MVPYLHSEIIYSTETDIFWERKFVFLPKKCNLSGKRIWLEYGIYGVKYIRLADQYSLIKIEYWHDEIEHTFWKLKL